MARICAIASLVVGILCTAPLRAEGLLYHLAEDSVWAKFEFVGNVVERDGKETTISGLLTMSSVGTSEVDGQKCRWIELTLAGKRNDLDDQPLLTMTVKATRSDYGKDAKSAIPEAK